MTYEEIEKILSYYKSPNAEKPADNVSIIRSNLSKEALIEKLMYVNIGLVIATVNDFRSYENQSIAYEDLMQEGTIGLMEAIKRFDVTLGNSFATYAQYWIDQRIIKLIRDMQYTIRIPSHVYDRMYSVNQGRKTKEKGRLITEDDKIECIRIKEMNNLKSLNDVTPCGEEVIDNVAYEGYSLEDSAIRSTIFFEVSKGMKKLTKNQRQAVELVFGLNGGYPHTHKEVGSIMRVSKTRAGQLTKAGVRRLKKMAVEIGVDEF
jgi:RNA polymerase primary sigma factor